MTEIKDDQGRVYVLKTEMESIIKDRVSKVAQRASEAELRAKQLETELTESQKAQATTDILTSQIEELKGKLASSNKKYTRFQAISKHGLTDSDMVDAVEWAYEREMGRLAKKDRIDLSSWLDGCVSDPTSAPSVLRPHLTQLQPTDPVVENSTQAQLHELGDRQQDRSFVGRPPKVNTGVRSAPDQPDLIDRAMRDPDFYRENRDQVKRAWESRSKRQR